MSYQYFDEIPITGTINSGTTGSTGVWSSPIDLEEIAVGGGATWVNGAGAAVIRVFNKFNSGNRWAGVRIPSGSAEFLADVPLGEYTDIVVVLEGQRFIELYTENATEIDCLLVGAYGSGWTWYPVSARPSIASTGSSWQTRTAAVPADSTIVTDFVGFQWRPVGETTHFTNDYSGRHTLMKVNGSSSIQLNTFSALSIKGHSVGLVNWNAWKSVDFVPVIDSDWHDAPVSVSAGKAAMLMFDKSSSATCRVRPKGSLKNTNIVAFHASPDETYVVGTASSGIFEYKIETGSTVPLVRVLGDVNPIPPLQITVIDKLESSSLSTASVSDSAYTATSINITSDGVTKNVSTTSIGGGSFTFTPPLWANNETALKYGESNTVVATDGTTSTQPATAVLTLPSPQVAVTLTSVSANSLDKVAGFTPAWKIGTQVVYDATKGTAYANGEYDDLIFDDEFWVSSGFEGTTQIWDRDPDDKIARLGNLILQNGGVVVDTNPDADTFGTVSGRPVSTPTPAAKTITLAGMTPDADSLAAATGGLRYRVSTDGGATFGALTTASTNVRNGYVLDAEVTSAGTVDTTVVGTLTVGTTAFTLTVTTRPADNIPDALLFTSTENSELLTQHTSETRTVTGMDVGETSNFTVANGTYSKNGGAFVSTAGVMQNGDTFALRGTSDTYFGRTVNVTLTAANGNVASIYRITNKLDPLLPAGGSSAVAGQFLTGYTL